MLFSSLALSSDSLIVTVALSAGLPPLHMVQLTALFGIFDAGASMIGPAMGAQIAAPSSIAPIFLVLWGGLIMLNMPSLALWCRRPRQQSPRSLPNAAGSRSLRCTGSPPTTITR
jgi:hypothetical protein